MFGIITAIQELDNHFGRFMSLKVFYELRKIYGEDPNLPYIIRSLVALTNPSMTVREVMNVVQIIR